MTDAVQQLLASFDQLSPADQLVVVKEIDKRIATELDHSPLSDDDLVFLADELFQMADREEEHRRNV
ncbi:MAG TPA: hypothetical protein VHZ24_06690 [Pirellulales bacterium]|jgi:hypothetical protein|nr:hypothetical protein [Pirellulales bacterium]